MKIESQANRNCTPTDASATHLVRLRFTAPTAEINAVRTPVNVSFVMDRSGSMDGAKLETARAAIDASIRMLRDADRFSVVMFDGGVRAVTKSTDATETARLKAQNRVNRVGAGGNTNLSGGWFEGAKQIRGFEGNGHTARVLLATDGQANEGITDEVELIEAARQLRAQGISTSTIGIGHDFNESLLQGIAEQGGGNFYYVERIAQLTDLLTSELGEALEITVRQPRVELAVPAGAEVTLLNRFEVERADGGFAVLLDDLSSGQAVELSFLVTVPAATPGQDQALGFVIRGGVGRVVLASTAVSWSPASAGQFLLAPREFLVETAVAKAMLAGARREALEHNKARRFIEARRVLTQIAEQLQPLVVVNHEIRHLLMGLNEEGRDYDTDMPDCMMKARRMAAFVTTRSRDVAGRALREFDE